MPGRPHYCPPGLPVHLSTIIRSELDEGISVDRLHALKTGPALGNDRFNREVEELTCQRRHHLTLSSKRKPKPEASEEFLP